MRLLRLTTNYPAYLKQFYARNESLGKQPYSTQYEKLVDDCFGWADFWTHALEKVGYQVWEPIGNAESMQKMWAEENKLIYDGRYWLTEIAISQVRQFKPTILFADDYSTYTSDFLNYIRQECPSIKLILGWCGAPNASISDFCAYDIVLSNIPHVVSNLRKGGFQSEYIKHAFEPRVLEKIDLNHSKNIPFSFLGSIVKSNSFHNQREELIIKLLQTTNLEVFSDVIKLNFREKLKTKLRQATYDTFQVVNKSKLVKQYISELPEIYNFINNKRRPDFSNYVNSLIASQSHTPLFGLEMFQGLHNSQITLNNHIDFSSDFASNMRLFEATGIGTCLLTDWKQNLFNMFELDREIVTYKSVEECVEKVNWLLKHPKALGEIAKSGQERTLKDHTFACRALELDIIIRRHLSQS
jgi:spore maturation protein CgeB